MLHLTHFFPHTN